MAYWKPMNKERMEKLARWWNEASSQLETGDGETVKRKLQLMEAELRVALRSEAAPRRRIALLVPVAIATAAVLAVVLSVVLLQSGQQPYTVALQGEPLMPPVTAEPHEVAPPTTLEAVPPPNNSATVSSTRKAPSRPRPAKGILAARPPRPPAEDEKGAPVTVTGTPLEPSPARSEPETSRETEASTSLDALALLVMIEQEFEQ